MSNADRLRVALNLVLPPLLPVAGYLSALTGLGHSIADSPGGIRTAVVPAPYAFSIWGPIFALSIGYGIWQALPAQRAHPLLRRVGWATAAGFALSIAWMITAQLTRNGWHLVAIIAAYLVAALAAFLPASRVPAITAGQRWLLRPMLGLLAGWVSAATVVNLSGAAASEGFGWFGMGSAQTAMLLILLTTGFASAVLRRSGGDLWYAAAVLWALAAIIVSNLGQNAEPGVALISGMGMGLILLAVLGARRPTRGAVEA